MQYTWTLILDSFSIVTLTGCRTESNNYFFVRKSFVLIALVPPDITDKLCVRTEMPETFFSGSLVFNIEFRYKLLTSARLQLEIFIT